MKTALIVLGVLLLLGVVAMAVFVFVVQNVEQPAYQSVKQDGDFEIRDYPALVVAQVRRQGPRKEALSAGFGPLARYIFAKERTGERISMTAPVTQQRKNAIPLTRPETAPQDAEDWTVGFIMPAQYRLDQLPAPANGEVYLSEIAPRRVAAVRFTGRADDALMASKEIDLRAWMASHRLTPATTAVFAYYNDPLTPGPLRRNEVLIDVIGPAGNPLTGVRP
ncbi:MAG TPA: heme-binding protein [Lamprocystis sp. (in: g-proteobacteria)]|nr:heme-binding protein [Lamprocystis sp. (in: g-proteobacteria)]